MRIWHIGRYKDTQTNYPEYFVDDHDVIERMDENGIYESVVGGTDGSKFGNFIDINKLESDIINYKKDLRLLINCESMEDVTNTEFHTWNFARMFGRDIDNRGKNFDETKDYFVDFITEQIKKLKSQIQDGHGYNSNASELMTTLETELSNNYDIDSASNGSITIKVPEGATHKDCIAFVDEVVRIADAKFNFTGRGGSWTMWNLVASNGVKLKAGWLSSSGELWVVMVA